MQATDGLGLCCLLLRRGCACHAALRHRGRVLHMVQTLGWVEFGGVRTSSTYPGSRPSSQCLNIHVFLLSRISPPIPALYLQLVACYLLARARRLQIASTLGEWSQFCQYRLSG